MKAKSLRLIEQRKIDYDGAHFLAYGDVHHDLDHARGDVRQPQMHHGDDGAKSYAQ